MGESKTAEKATNCQLHQPNGIPINGIPNVMIASIRYTRQNLKDELAKSKQTRDSIALAEQIVATKAKIAQIPAVIDTSLKVNDTLSSQQNNFHLI